MRNNMLVDVTLLYSTQEENNIRYSILNERPIIITTEITQ